MRFLNCSESFEWTGSSWRENFPKYCKVCKKRIHMGTVVKFCYAPEYKGMSHISCLNKLEKELEEKFYERQEEKLIEAHKIESKPLTNGNLPSPKQIAELLKVSPKTFSNAISGKCKNKNTIMIIESIVKHIGYPTFQYQRYGIKEFRYYWPGRFFSILHWSGEEEKLRTPNQVSFELCLTDLRHSIDLMEFGLTMFVHKSDNYFCSPQNNPRASYWAKKPIKDNVFLCPTEHKDLIKNWDKLNPARLPEPSLSELSTFISSLISETKKTEKKSLYTPKRRHITIKNSIAYAEARKRWGIKKIKEFSFK